MGVSRSTLVHDIRNQLSAMLMLITLLERTELPDDVSGHLSLAGTGFRSVLDEPDLATTSHHDLDSALSALLQGLAALETEQISDELVQLCQDAASRVPSTREMWVELAH
jgi:hypothetical protein